MACRSNPEEPQGVKSVLKHHRLSLYHKYLAKGTEMNNIDRARDALRFVPVHDRDIWVYG